jgi:hypothetical protein
MESPDAAEEVDESHRHNLNRDARPVNMNAPLISSN